MMDSRGLSVVVREQTEAGRAEIGDLLLSATR